MGDATEHVGTDGPGSKPASSSADRRLEAFVVLLISLTAILTAWTTFQSAKWAGEQTNAIARAEAARAEAESYYNDSREEYIVDVLVFNNWLDAELTGDADLAEDYLLRFSDTLFEAFEEWDATNPLDNPDAPVDPFEEYTYPNDVLGDEQFDIAEMNQSQALTNNQRGDNYTAMSIVFATVILFAALADKLPGASTQRILLGIATTGLVIGGGILATFPIVV